MALILAIEPDRHQAAHLTSVVRRRVGAELILVDTTASALDAIGSRVPDLLLVPALLSPQDDAALATALRVIAAAAHVQMLTTPVLGAIRPSARPSGGLLGLRRDRSRAVEPEGCDPTVFAEQIASYLERAAAERSALAEDDVAEDDVAEDLVTEDVVVEDDVPEDFVAAQAEQIVVEGVVAEDVVAEDSRGNDAVEEPAVAAVSVSVEAWSFEDAFRDLLEAPESVQVDAQEPTPQQEPDEEFQQFETVEPFETLESVEEEQTEQEEQAGEEVVDIDLSDEFEDAAEVPGEYEEDEEDDVVVLEAGEGDLAEELAHIGEEPVPVAESIVEAPAPVRDEATLALAVEEAFRGFFASNDPEPEPEPEPELEPAAALEAAPALLEEIQPVPRAWPSLEGLPAESIEMPVVVAAPEPQPAPAPEPVAVVPATKGEREWVELVASLRHDIERLRTEGVKPASAAPAARPPRPPRKRHSAQDEWGLFDPEQCGFAALLAKLDEVTQAEDGVRG